MDKIENIGKKDIAWSFVATIFMIGAGILLLPFILNKFSTETVGIWNIFQVITALVALLDFGFQPSFARNISYIFTGVKELKTEGVSHTTPIDDIDYELLQSTLLAMRRFYRYMALIVFVVLLTLGSCYLAYVLRSFSGNKIEIWIAWVFLIAINCFNLYTFYYDALLSGKGYIKRAQQINVIGQLCYLLVGIGLIYAGCGLVSIVSSQLLAVIVKRILMNRVFYTYDLKEHLAKVDSKSLQTKSKEILRIILPNAIKMGLTNVSGWLVYKSAIVIGSAMLSLEVMASYGITLQIVDILARCGTVVYMSYVPKISQYRVENNYKQLQKIYILSIGFMLLVMLLGGAVVVFWGNWTLNLIHSQTLILSNCLIIGLLIVHILEWNHVISWGFLLADNRVPFYIPSIISGVVTVVLTWIFLKMGWGVWGLILAPGLTQLAYQNWKWPVTTIKEIFYYAEKK